MIVQMAGLENYSGENMVEITKDDFEAYEEVRQSGVTNMFAIKTVMQLSGLSKEECLDIMENYGEYKERFMERS